MKIRYVLTSVGLSAAILVATPTAALAAWDTPAGEADVTARAAVVPALRAPIAVAVGPVVTVTWRRTNFAAVRGYRVTRTDARTGDVVNARNGCSGLLTKPVCVELNVPDGRWAYAVEAVVGANWRSERAAGEIIQVFRAGPDGAPEPQVAPTPTGKPAAPETRDPESTPEPTRTPDREPAPEPTQTPDPDSTPDPEQTPDPDPEQKPEPELEQKPKPEPKPEQKPKPEPKPEQEPELNSQPKLEPERKPDAEPKPSAGVAVAGDDVLG